MGITNYVVTANRGGLVTIFRGTFTGGGTGGGRGSGRHIATFTHNASSALYGTVGDMRPRSIGPMIRPESRIKLLSRK